MDSNSNTSTASTAEPHSEPTAALAAEMFGLGYRIGIRDLLSFLATDERARLLAQVQATEE